MYSIPEMKMLEWLVVLLRGADGRISVLGAGIYERYPMR